MPTNPASETRQTVAANIKALREGRGWSQNELAKQTRGEVGQKTISDIEACKYASQIDTLDALAVALGLAGGWQLQIPNLTEELKNSSVILKIVADYISADEEGKDLLARTASRVSSKTPPSDPDK